MVRAYSPILSPDKIRLQRQRQFSCHRNIHLGDKGDFSFKGERRFLRIAKSSTENKCGISHKASNRCGTVGRDLRARRAPIDQETNGFTRLTVASARSECSAAVFRAQSLNHQITVPCGMIPFFGTMTIPSRMK